ncbi:MAG: YbjP/YqhG family protein [Reyranella sp.]|nr:YbjP/YqhG family protein [Reyranella sp.]
MPSRRLILAALGALPTSAWAQAQPQSPPQPSAPKETVTPEAFLRGIYTPYPNQDFKGQPFWQVDRFFAPDLARAIEADMREAKRRGEVPKLDGDPFVDAQDWDIDKLAISVKADGPKATGLVSFENQGKPTEITLDLVRTGMGWRITDIKSPSGKLSELYTK